MKKLHLSSKELDIAKYKKRSAYLSDVKRMINEDVIIFKNNEPIILYKKLPNDLTYELRWAVKKTKYHKGKRSRGLISESRIFGYAPRVAMRHNYCHSTSMANEHPKEHYIMSNFSNVLEGFYKKYFSGVYKKHQEIVSEKVLKQWKMQKSVFTSGIINKNNQLNYHFDSGNFKGVMSNMIAFKKDVDGGHLAIPEFDIALEIDDSTLTIFNGQEILHGVTPIHKKNSLAYRYTSVYYSLQQMWKCDPIGDEIKRVREVQQKREKTRLDPEHLKELQLRKEQLLDISEKEKRISKIKNEQN